MAYRLRPAEAHREGQIDLLGRRLQDAVVDEPLPAPRHIGQGDAALVLWHPPLPPADLRQTLPLPPLVRRNPGGDVNLPSPHRFAGVADGGVVHAALHRTDGVRQDQQLGLLTGFDGHGCKRRSQRHQ
jgi:hypothetical protein